MQWIYSVFTAALVTGACYGMLYRSDSVYQLELRKKGNWITDKAVFGIVGLTFIGTLAVGKLRLLLDYTDDPHDIEDPWYSGDFEKAYREIREGCTGYLKQFRVK